MSMVHGMLQRVQEHATMYEAQAQVQVDDTLVGTSLSSIYIHQLLSTIIVPIYINYYSTLVLRLKKSQKAQCKGNNELHDREPEQHEVPRRASSRRGRGRGHYTR